MKQRIYTICLAIGLLLLVSGTSHAQFYYNDSATGKKGLFQPRGHIANYTANGRASIPAYYPEGAFGAIAATDVDGNGWLRLTNGIWQTGYVITNDEYPSKLGIEIEFEYGIWGNVSVDNLADGFSVFLYDGILKNDAATTDVTSNFRRGRAGGCLGYIPLSYASGDVKKGLKGGYLGVGIDAYGNAYRHSEENRQNASAGLSTNLMKKNTIVLWGPSALKYNEPNEGNHNQGYELIKYKELGYKVAVQSSTRPSSSTYYRKVRITLNPIYENDVFKRTEVKVYTKSTVNGSEVLSLSGEITKIPPESFKIGFAATTGSLWANMEVRNVKIKTPGIIAAGRSYINCFEGYSNFSITSMMTNFIKVVGTGPSHTLKAVDKLPPYFEPDSYKVFFKDAENTYIELATSDSRYPIIDIDSYTTNGNARTYTYTVPLKEFGITYVEWHGHFVNRPTNDVFTSNLQLNDVPDYDDTLLDNYSARDFVTYLAKPKDNTYVRYLDTEESTVIMKSNENSVTLATEINNPNNETLTYTWEKADDPLANAPWTTISGATGSSLTVTYDGNSKNIKYYRCNIYRGYQEVVNNTAQKCVHNQIIYKVIQHNRTPF